MNMTDMGMKHLRLFRLFYLGAGCRRRYAISGRATAAGGTSAARRAIASIEAY
jgi:hypothetical protein